MIDVNAKTIAIGAGAAIGLYLFAKHEIRVAFKAVNPIDRDNVFNRGVNTVGANVTGDEHFSLGVRLFEWFNPDVVERERRILEARNRVTHPDDARALGTSTFFPSGGGA